MKSPVILALSAAFSLAIVEATVPTPLQDAKNGAMTMPLSETLRTVAELGIGKGKCLIERPDSRVHYSFRKSENAWSVAHNWNKNNQTVTELGSLPRFDAVAYACDQIQVPGRKWNNLDEFKAATQDDVDAIETALAPLAHDPTATRFSGVEARIINTPR